MFKSQDIFLRRMEEEDLPYKVQWINDEEVNETLLFDFPFSLSETKEWYKRTHFNRSRWDFVVVENNTNKVVGMTGLINLSQRHKNAQFFITLGDKSIWGKGYSKQVIPLVLEFAFCELGLEKVYLFTLENNEKARYIYEKIGFNQEAYKKNEYFIHGKFHNLFHHAILKEEFLVKYNKTIK